MARSETDGVHSVRSGNRGRGRGWIQEAAAFIRPDRGKVKLVYHQYTQHTNKAFLHCIHTHTHLLICAYTHYAFLHIHSQRLANFWIKRVKF